MTTQPHFIERLQRMVVNASSPDGSVTMRLSNSEGLSVTLSDRALRHGEQSLGEQATHALRGIRSGYRKGFTRVVASAGGHAEPGTTPGTRSPRAATPRQPKRDELTARLEGLRSEALSPHGHVRVVMAPYGRATVRFTPGSLGNSAVTPWFLAEEIRAAAVEAHTDLERSKRKVLESREQSVF